MTISLNRFIPTILPPARKRWLLHSDKVRMAQEVNDIPNPAYPYQPTGWMSDDSKILVNDRYDIWMVDPDGRAEPVNLNG
ncbi:MAG: hypothetical protein R2744_02785 [Bacteroidales bacterium]